MKYSHKQIMNLSTEELNSIKGKIVDVQLRNGESCKGVIENLIEASISQPEHLISAIIIKKTIELSQINSLELID